MHTPITTPIDTDPAQPAPPPPGTVRLDDPRGELWYGGTQAAILVAVAGSAAVGAGTAALAASGIVRILASATAMTFTASTILLLLAVRPNLKPAPDLTGYAVRRHRLVRAAIDVGIGGAALATIGFILAVATT